MATHRIGETNLSGSAPSNHHLPYEVLHGINSGPAATFMNQEGSPFDFGELQEAIVLQGVKIRNDEAKTSLFTGRPAATLEMFPSWPMRFQQVSSKSGGESTDSGSAVNTLSSRAEAQLEPESPISIKPASDHQPFDQKQLQFHQHQQQSVMASDNSRLAGGPSETQPAASKPHPEKVLISQAMTTVPNFLISHLPSSLAISHKLRKSSSSSTIVSTTELPSASGMLPQLSRTSQTRKGAGSISDKPLDAKILRRLAQNREAARKSRLRKKAYVQQLETSRIRLTQLEQDLQRARSQGLFLGGGGAGGIISAGAAIFDMEYARWLEDDHRHMSELRAGLQANLLDGDLRVIVDGYLSHYDEIFRLKGVAAKADVFHLITGMWTTPAERCFLWMGGFRPSDLIKMLTSQLDPLTEQQVMGICGLQHSLQQAEEALSQGQEQLQQSLIETIAGGSITDEMAHMVVALGHLTNLEGFVRQADHLRQQTLHQLCRILTVRQAAHCFLMIGDYYGRLRALSSLWSSRPREAMMRDENSCQTSTDLQMVQASQSHFTNF